MAKATVVWDEGQPQKMPPLRKPSWKPWLLSMREPSLAADI